jgi:hypothetical protein
MSFKGINSLPMKRGNYPVGLFFFLGLNANYSLKNS